MFFFGWDFAINFVNTDLLLPLVSSLLLSALLVFSTMLSERRAKLENKLSNPLSVSFRHRRFENSSAVV